MPTPQRFSTMVIGGSAGSVEALTTLLPAFQASCGLRVAVVVHLPRERPSRLAELFASRCQLSVVEADDKQPFEPGTIYFAPPDYHLLLDAGSRLSLAADELVHYSRPSIDVLFESAADVYGPSLMGLILSGANEDGAAGLAAVGRAGGLTLVQEPGSASAATMPAAALRAAPQSRALQPQDLAAILREIRDGVWPANAPTGGARS
jgi:two-component system, chemotaxis family, protein-glutamate methylesterase/glutaminase